MSIATNPMGLKRICTSCGGRFYDLNKRPIICPTCETEFTGDIKVKARRNRVATEEKKVDAIVEEVKSKKIANTVSEDEDILEDEDDGVEVVSLEDAEPPAKDDVDGDASDTASAEVQDDALADIPDLDIDATDDNLDDALLDDEED